MTSVCEKQTPICMNDWDVILAFFVYPKRKERLEYILLKGGNRMKRKVNVRSKKRTTRPAALKQQIIRKEERKQAKYPVHVVHVSAVMPRCRNRGV